MSINSNHNNISFDLEIGFCSNWVREKIFAVGGYESKALRDRLLQRMVEIGLQPYASAVNDLRGMPGADFPAPGVRIDCGTASIEMGSGRIYLTAKQLLGNFFQFLLQWFFCCLSIIAIKKAVKNNFPTVLVFGVGSESLFKSGSDEQFVSYCKHGPIKPLQDGKRYLVELTGDRPPSSSDELLYARRPHIRLIREADLGTFGRGRLLVKHGILLFSYLTAILRCPPLSLLGRDFAYSQIFFELDRRELIDSVVLTCSNYTSQLLWCRALENAKVHMVWYAQNWRPIGYRSDGVTSDVPNLRWIRVDTHWVWTHTFAEYLRSLIHGAHVEVVGPIVWSLPPEQQPTMGGLTVVIFDVSPFSDEVAIEYGEISNYFCPKNLFNFIKNIVALKSVLEQELGLPICFRLKTKRGQKAIYSGEYFSYLRQLDADKIIILEHHSTSLYSLIAESQFVIAYPFTSPVHIADYLGVPSVYYDPTDSILRQDFSEPDSLASFASNPDQLNSIALSAMRGAMAIRAGDLLLN